MVEDIIKKLIASSRNISSNIKICCKGLKQLVDEKAIVFFHKGTLWCGIPNKTFALNYDNWIGNGCNCMIIEDCPFCKTKLKLNSGGKKWKENKN